jgi:hypothetical protein
MDLEKAGESCEKSAGSTAFAENRVKENKPQIIILNVLPK